MLDLIAKVLTIYKLFYNLIIPKKRNLKITLYFIGLLKNVFFSKDKHIPEDRLSKKNILF